MRQTSTRKAADDRGFTLIEMMVVVTIIGILAAVAIPRYISYVRSSQTAEVGQVGGSIVSAIQAYADAQNLSPASVKSTFNSTYLCSASEKAGTVAGATCTATGGDIAAIIPQLNLPANAVFTYTVSVEVAGASSGPQGGDPIFCITATGTGNSGVSGGTVLYSSSAPINGVGGWDGRMNKVNYASNKVTSPTAGGYCGATGTASTTFADGSAASS